MNEKPWILSPIRAGYNATRANGFVHMRNSFHRLAAMHNGYNKGTTNYSREQPRPFTV